MIAPWLVQTQSLLAQRMVQGTLRGGVLLLGDVGLGTQVLARSLAGILLCEQRGEVACGQCSGCRWVAQSQHPDLLVIAPEEDSAVIKVDAIREMSSALEKKSARGGYQVVIITSAEALNVASSNALLKTLEEPPGDVVFLLCCQQKRSLLPTIVSRCEQCELPSVTDEQATQWLSSQYPQLNNAMQWLRWAKHAPYAIAALLENQYNHWRDRLLADYLAIATQPTDVLSLSTAWQKASLPVLLDVAMSLVSDLIRLQSGGKKTDLTHQDVLDTLQQLTASASQSALWRYYDYLLSVNRHHASGMVNERLVCDELALRWESVLESKQEEMVC